MSIIHGVIGSLQGESTPPPPPSPYAYATYAASPTEGYTTDVRIYVENWDGSRIYWSVVGKDIYPINTDTDISGTLSGFWDPGSGTLSTGVTTITFIADQETEGTEYWGVNLGTTPGGSDIWNGNSWSVSDASLSPAGKGYGAVGGSLAFYTNDGYLSLNDASLAPGTGEFAFEALVRFELRGSYYSGFIVGQGDEGSWLPQDGISIWLDNGALYVWVADSNVGAVSYNLSAETYQNTWMRVAVARTTGGYVRTFVNGVNKGNFYAPGNVSNTQLDIGAQRRLINFSNSYYFYGKMTNIHWNTDATYVNNKFNTGSDITNELTARVAATTGTQFLLNTISDATKTVDSSSNNRTATVTGTLGYSALNSYLVPYLWLDADNSESYSGTGTKWFSLGSSDKHATLRNSPTFGVIGSSPAVPAITFDGRVSPNQYADGANLGQNDFNTVSVWVYLNGNVWPPASGQFPAFFVEEYPGTTSKIAFNLGHDTFNNNTTKFAGSLFNNSWYVPATYNNPSTQTWYMLTLSQGDNGDKWNPVSKFYVNGTLQGSGMTTTPLITSLGKYFINHRWDANEGYDASYAVVQMFNQALTSSQVTELWNAQKSRFGY